MGGRVYAESEKRRALSAAYTALNTKGNHNRYVMTRFGVSIEDPSVDVLTFQDVLNCLAGMHNDMCAKEKEANADRGGVTP